MTERFARFITAEDGAILFVTDEDTGALYRVVPEEGICRTP